MLALKTVRDCAQILSDAGATVDCRRPACLSDARNISERYWHMQQSSGAEVQRLFADWDRFRSAMLSFMANYDVIVCPVDAETAPLLEMEKEKSRHGMFNYTLPYSLSGWPCVVLPAGASGVNGLPIGVQIIANAWHEHVALAVATQIEAVPPPNAWRYRGVNQKQY